MLIEQALLLLAIVGLVWIGWQDLWTYRVRNIHVLALIALYIVFAFVQDFVDLPSDLAAALVLFLLGFLFWILKMMGAGDAKLYFPLGLFAGLSGLVPFAIGLIGASTALVVLTRMAPAAATRQTGLMGRLAVIRKEKKIPYAVPMAIGGVIAIFYRLTLY